MGIKEQLYDALKLAEFANLETTDIDSFRAKYPDFAPEGWWEALELPVVVAGEVIKNPTSDRPWKRLQQELREAWQTKFPCDICVSLIEQGAKLSEHDQFIQEVSARALKMDNASALEFLAKQNYPPIRVWDYQRAVMFLFVQSWRAVFCMSCGKRFVKDTKGRLYCSEKCYGPHRAQAKRLSEKKRYRTRKQKNK